ncbi:MAG: hypothetical protein FJX34_05000 [Alphaproteobacteria bacterium]|nr:hypothetical protein [Alphaproteobacteria bacterium]
MTTIAAMEEVIADSNGAEPQVWIPQLIEILKELEEERIAAQKEKLRQEAVARMNALRRGD